MIAKQTNHGKAANNTATATHPEMGANVACRGSTASATGRAGDVPSAPVANKNAARRKEKRKQREAASRTAAHWAKQGIPREMRGWLDF